MFRTILWILIGVLTAWLFWQRLRKGSPMAAIGWIFGIAVLVYLGLAVLLFAFQHKLLYMPWRAVEMNPSDIRLEYEDVRIDTPDGQTLAGWYIPAEQADFTVLFCHGNAGNIGHRLDTLAVFHELGLNCLIFGYRGYGDSTGRPTEEGTVIDALAAYRWLIDHKHTSPQSIILFGRSLGGAVATQAAARLTDTPPAGLVLESSFTSFVDVGAHFYPWLPVRWFARFTYDTEDTIQAVTCPVIIIHSPDDEMIPYQMGRRLYNAAPEPKQFAELKGTHNEGFVNNPALYREIWIELVRFIRQAPR